MLECLSFLLQMTINFIKVLFDVDVGFTSLGTVFCIVFILFPIILAIVQFIKTTFIEELDDAYDNPNSSLRERLRYHGRHEPVGRHSREYRERMRRF